MPNFNPWITSPDFIGVPLNFFSFRASPSCLLFVSAWLCSSLFDEDDEESDDEDEDLFWLSESELFRWCFLLYSFSLRSTSAPLPLPPLLPTLIISCFRLFGDGEKLLRSSALISSPLWCECSILIWLKFAFKSRSSTSSSLPMCASFSLESFSTRG